MSEKKDDRTDEEKHEEVRERLKMPIWQERSMEWLAQDINVHGDIVAEERRKLRLRMDGKLLGQDGKLHPCGQGRVSRDRVPVSGERIEPLLALYKAVVCQLQTGSSDPSELQQLAGRAEDAAGYLQDKLNGSSPKKRKTK
jgi:hypothetical protein